MTGLWRTGAAVLLAGGLSVTAAAAKVSGYLGDWRSPHDAGLLGGLVGSNRDEIARIVVTPAGVDHVRIHLYGRCKTCDWGDELGHNHSDSPDSDAVRSITAAFKTPDAVRRITLRPAPGRELRVDAVTDFTDHSGRHDYEASWTFAPATLSAAGVSVAAAPQAAPPSAEPAEDCVAINPADVYVAPPGHGWKVEDFNHVILNFHDHKEAAFEAARVMKFYHFDEQCYVVRPHPRMIYWRVGGRVPRDPMPGQDCTTVHYADVAARHIGGAWKVVDGPTVLIDYGEDAVAARLAASVIRTYRLDRQCFVAKPDTAMVYWLAQ